MKEPGKKAISAASRPSEADQPLKGKTIVITRARDQAGQITQMIECLGASVIHCPTIEIIEPESWAALDAAIHKIETYDWIIFTSANGAEFFFQRLAALGKDAVSSVSSLTVCAIGPATAKAIEKAGIRAAVIATDSKAEGALKAIIEHCGGKEKVRGLRLLIPRARIAREVLPLELTKLGAEVDAVETYQTIKPDIDRKSFARLFAQKKIDAITFTSPSTVNNFAATFETSDLSILLEGVLIACIGPVTAQAAARFKLKNIKQPESYNSEALVDMIVRSIGRPARF